MPTPAEQIRLSLVSLWLGMPDFFPLTCQHCFLNSYWKPGPAAVVVVVAVASVSVASESALVAASVVSEVGAAVAASVFVFSVQAVVAAACNAVSGVLVAVF